MPSTLPREFEVVERATTRITCTLTEDDGVTPVPASTLSTLTVVILDTDADATILLAEQSILNTNNGTVDECGQVVLALTPAQMALAHATLPYERHLVRVHWTWGTNPVKAGYHEIVLILRNLAQVG